MSTRHDLSDVLDLFPTSRYSCARGGKSLVPENILCWQKEKREGRKREKGRRERKKRRKRNERKKKEKE